MIHHLLSKILSYFIIYLVSSNSFLYAVIFGRNIHKDLIFSIFVANKVFKCSFTKRNPIRHYNIINVYIFYWIRFFSLMKFLFLDFNITKFYDCFFPFLDMTSKFLYFLIYNVPLFSAKSAFCFKPIVKFVLT